MMEDVLVKQVSGSVVASWGVSIEFGGAGERGEEPVASSLGENYTVGKFSVTWRNMHPEPRFCETANMVVMLLGHPALGNSLDDEKVFDAIAAGASATDVVKELNGSFLVVIYNKLSESLKVASDRFSSIPIYYTRFGRRRWILSLHLSDLHEHLERCSVNETGLLQFLFLRRLLGEETVLKSAVYLRSAHILSVSSRTGEERLAAYWQPDFRQQPLSDFEVVDRLTSELPAALALYQSDSQNFGLLMSGGLDSRALLVSRAKPLVCFTTCLQENNESNVAKLVSQTENVEWKFIQRPEGVLNNYLHEALAMTSAQQVYNECQFMGYGQYLTETSSSMLIGLGLDIFFGGLYLPQQPARWFGYQALYNELLPLQPDLVSMYLNTVGYRLKQSDAWRIINPRSKSRVLEQLRLSVQQIMERARELGAEGYSVWEYMHVHNLSRHYSFPMMHSIRTYMDCRAPALENNLFDLSLNMTAKQKLNGTLYQKAMSRISPDAMNIRNANTNYPAYMSLRRQTALKAIQFSSHYLLGTKRGRSPSRADRSWPSARQHLEACPEILKEVVELPRSDMLASLDWIDMDAFRDMMSEHHEKRHDHTVLINVLLGIDSVIRKTRC